MDAAQSAREDDMKGLGWEARVVLVAVIEAVSWETVVATYKAHTLRDARLRGV